MIQNALVRPANDSMNDGPCYTRVLKTRLKNLTYVNYGLGVTGRIGPICFLRDEISLFRLLTIGWGFLVSVEVCSYQVFEKDAESPCSTIVHLVNFLPNHLFRFGR
jgi:hypothetical protein